MNNDNLIKCFFFCLAIVQFSVGSSAAIIRDLRCERLKNPLGIDVTKPGLSWIIESDRRGEIQTAYQILAASSPDALARNCGDLWDSGKVASEQSAQVQYSGKPLDSGMRCYWKARIWDIRGKPGDWSQPVFWTMGLLREEDWKGCWIGARPGTPSGKRVPLRNGDPSQTGAIDPADAPAVLLRREVTFPKNLYAQLQPSADLVTMNFLSTASVWGTVCWTPPSQITRGACCTPLMM